MAEPTWLSEIIESMKSLGGSASYKDLYDEIEQRGNIDFSIRKDPRAQIRGVIESHSSDSKVYDSNKNSSEQDVFYAVDGIGRGHWGLRNYIPDEGSVDLTEDDNSFPEGKRKLRMHICRERNQQVIKKAKEEYRNKYGNLRCQVCGFDFEKTYGEIGKDFIEGHHTIPVSDLKENDKTKVEDIALVCSNCHKMLHRKRPWKSINELKDLL